MSDDLVKSLNLGLSRFLRYSYAGLLVLLAFVHFADKTSRDKLFELDWSLIGLGVVIVGAMVYTVHRSVVIPVHHAIGCLIFYVFHDVWVEPKNRMSPVGCLLIGLRAGCQSKGLSVGYLLPRAFICYSLLRRDKRVFSDVEGRNIDHAENGMVVMTAVACFLMILFDSSHWVLWGSLLAVSLVASYIRGWSTHAVECRMLKYKRKLVAETLSEYGYKVEAASIAPPDGMPECPE
ncbi:MAG: hypothetical protein HQ567_19360 [Candidatus Nealsonbacteria bacterium]|nr:hypothetical protein [Candidatus Nealsonbacteria bacterium]